MTIFSNGSISRNILFLIILAVLPGVILVGWAGIEKRNEVISQAKREVFNLTGSLESKQQDLLKTTRALLKALSFSEHIINLDVEQSRRILAEIVAKEPLYQNFSITDPQGNALVSARPMGTGYLGDRLHIIEALRTRDFAVGEFIVSRLTRPLPGLPFSQPIFDAAENLVGLLNGVVNLEYLEQGFESAALAEEAFVAVTDREGVYLFRYPGDMVDSVGASICPRAWAEVASSPDSGLVVASDCDTRMRIFAYQSIVTAAGREPDFYVWASVPEESVLCPANASLKRNMLYVLSFFMITLTIAWFYGQQTIKTPLLHLTELAEKFALGNLDARANLKCTPEEIAELTRAFHNMALSLSSERQTLAEEKEFMTVTLKSIGDGVITTTVEGRVVLINEVASNITGYSQEEAAGKPLAEVFNIIDEASRQPCKSPVERVLETGHAVLLANHTILISRQGNEVSIADSGAPIKTSEGKIVGVVLVFRDVSKEQIMERELRKIGKLEAIGVLAGGIAHDFNNILTAILGNIELSLIEAKKLPVLKTYLTTAVKACKRASGLTQQLITFSRGGDPVKESASLPQLIKETSDFIIHGTPVSCEFDIPDDLWCVSIDRGQIGQVIQNLIINACQAMPDGGKITIRCRNVARPDFVLPHTAAGQKYVSLRIADQGPGIAADQIDKIFDPYFSTKKHGSGLGLAISHSIIRKHEGRITVNTSPGKGSEFCILLPASSAVASPKTFAPGEQVPFRPLKIMVMDDELIIREFARVALEDLGHSTVLVNDGAQAVETYRQHLGQGEPFDVVILDLIVPGSIGGKTAAKSIIMMDPAARIIVCSGSTGDLAMTDYQKFGFAASISKPYMIDTLKKVLDQVAFSRPSDEKC